MLKFKQIHARRWRPAGGFSELVILVLIERGNAALSDAHPLNIARSRFLSLNTAAAMGCGSTCNRINQVTVCYFGIWWYRLYFFNNSIALLSYTNLLNANHWIPRASYIQSCPISERPMIHFLPSNDIKPHEAEVGSEFRDVEVEDQACAVHHCELQVREPAGRGVRRSSLCDIRARSGDI